MVSADAIDALVASLEFIVEKCANVGEFKDGPIHVRAMATVSASEARLVRLQSAATKQAADLESFRAARNQVAQWGASCKQALSHALSRAEVAEARF